MKALTLMWTIIIVMVATLIICLILDTQDHCDCTQGIVVGRNNTAGHMDIDHELQVEGTDSVTLRPCTTSFNVSFLEYVRFHEGDPIDVQQDLGR